MSLPALRIHVLGPVSVPQADAPVALPRSRTVRALRGLLALAPSAISLTRPCALLWESCHRGLWQMYRFTGEEDQQAPSSSS